MYKAHLSLLVSIDSSVWELEAIVKFYVIGIIGNYRLMGF